MMPLVGSVAKDVSSPGSALDRNVKHPLQLVMEWNICVCSCLEVKMFL